MTNESTFWQRITFESGARRLEQQRRRALVEPPAVEAGGLPERDSVAKKVADAIRSEPSWDQDTVKMQLLPREAGEPHERICYLVVNGAVQTVAIFSTRHKASAYCETIGEDPNVAIVEMAMDEEPV